MHFKTITHITIHDNESDWLSHKDLCIQVNETFLSVKKIVIAMIHSNSSPSGETLNGFFSFITKRCQLASKFSLSFLKVDLFEENSVKLRCVSFLVVKLLGDFSK